MKVVREWSWSRRFTIRWKKKTKNGRVGHITKSRNEGERCPEKGGNPELGTGSNHSCDRESKRGGVNGGCNAMCKETIPWY